MTIFIPLLYICIEAKCGFFQSQNYILDEQKCLQEIDEKKIEFTKQGATVEAICVDMKINLEKRINVTDCCLPSW